VTARLEGVLLAVTEDTVVVGSETIVVAAIEDDAATELEVAAIVTTELEVAAIVTTETEVLVTACRVERTEVDVAEVSGATEEVEGFWCG